MNPHYCRHCVHSVWTGTGQLECSHHIKPCSSRDMWDCDEWMRATGSDDDFNNTTGDR